MNSGFKQREGKIDGPNCLVQVTVLIYCKTTVPEADFVVYKSKVIRHN